VVIFAIEMSLPHWFLIGYSIIRVDAQFRLASYCAL
jgi:hypothetical protein